MTIWMKVTKDKYELPIAVADSPMELARILGISSNTINSSISHVKTGKIKTSVFKKVEVDDE